MGSLHGIIAFLYTIKLNLLLLRNKDLRNYDYEFDYFIKYAVWGYDVLKAIPYTGYSSNSISRARFILSSAKVFNCIANSFDLPDYAYLELTDRIYISHKFTQKSVIRDKYIFAWIIFGMLCNNYDPRLHDKKFTMKPWERFMYDNAMLVNSVQVSIENFIIRMCMLESLYYQLNCEILGITIEEFQQAIDVLKRKNRIWMFLSEKITTNVEIVQGLLEFCARNNDYRKKTESELDRSQKLVEKFFENITEYFQKMEYDFSELKDEEVKKKVCYLQYGDNVNETISIPELYAQLIQQANNYYGEQKETNTLHVNKQMLEFRSLLEMKNITQIGYNSFAKKLRKDTKLTKVRKHLLNMAGDIGKYMLLSDNKDYLSNEWKIRLCRLYEDVLKVESADRNAIVTDSIQQEYNEAANKFNRDHLKKAINSLIDVQKN